MRRWVEIAIRRHRLNGSYDSDVRIIETSSIPTLAGAINALCADGWTVVRIDQHTQCESCRRLGTCTRCACGGSYSDCPDHEPFPEATS